MNIENLKRTVELLRKLDNRMFNMQQYRNPGSEKSQKCGTVGCIVGHATILDSSENWEKYIKKQPVFKSQFSITSEFDFTGWSQDFFGLDPMNEQDVLTWEYLFNSKWGWSEIMVDKKILLLPEIFNSPKHAMYRINKVINGYQPGMINDELLKEIEIIEKDLVV